MTIKWPLCRINSSAFIGEPINGGRVLASVHRDDVEQDSGPTMALRFRHSCWVGFAGLSVS
jgi:hypothetical protein